MTSIYQPIRSENESVEEWLKRIVLHPIGGNSNKLIEKILECISVS